MKKLVPIFLAGIFAAVGGWPAGALEKDFLVGVNVDVAPFGIECVIPGAAVFVWPLEDLAVSPGVDAELYLGPDRIEVASHVYLRGGTARAAPFAGAGAAHLYGTYFGHMLNEWVPEVQAGLRIAVPRWPVLYPVLSVRFKKGDTDSGAVGLVGWGF